MRNKIFLLLSLTGFIFPQEYQITNVPVSQYSIDRYTNEIYYDNYFTGEIFKTNSTGTYHTLTEFTSVPQFSNHNHTAVFIDRHSQTDKDLYLYDFEKDTLYFLVNYPYLGPYLLFSPSDDKILVAGGSEIVYYSFEDGLVHNTGFTIYTDVVEWLSDTTIVYITLGGVDIRVLNINDLSENIIVQSASLENLRGLATNLNIGAFAYSREYNSSENTFINLYYPQTGLDTTVYNFLEQGPYPGGNFTIFIRDLSWEKNSNKLGFIGEILFVSTTLIYVFDYNSLNTYLYSEPLTTGEGIKYYLDWLNRDTVIYSDFTDDQFLFGLDVTNPVSVEDKFLALKFSLAQNYPNPFNPTTTIKYQIPTSGNVTIKVYDILGNEVANLVDGYMETGRYEVDFDASSLASGVYIYRLNVNEYTSVKKMVLLK